MRSFLRSALLAAGTMALSAVPAMAQINIAPSGQFAPLSTVTVPLIIGALVRIVLIVAAIIFFFMLVIGGIQWMTSGGDKAATEGARGRVTAALIGLVIVFAAYAIISLVSTMFGLSILSFEIPKFIP